MLAKALHGVRHRNSITISVLSIAKTLKRGLKAVKPSYISPSMQPGAGPAHTHCRAAASPLFSENLHES